VLLLLSFALFALNASLVTRFFGSVQARYANILVHCVSAMQ
jgi:hypothetical protein